MDTERLHVYGGQGVDDAAAGIVVNIDGLAAPTLTAGEARELIEALQLVLGQVQA